MELYLPDDGHDDENVASEAGTDCQGVEDGQDGH